MRVAEITVAADQADLVSGLVWVAGVSAVAEHPLDGGQVLLRTDLPAGGADAIRATVGHLAEVREVVLDDDGLDAWRDHAAVVVAGERVVVRPPWIALDHAQLPPDPIVVEIDPGRSWGHGAHPTTILCLREVERTCRERVGMSVVDVGCGSGALGIAAAVLGAARVWACDIDPAAVSATRDNAARNRIADRVEVHHVVDRRRPLGTLQGRHDLILANIGAATLRELAADLVAHAADDATIVISGLLDPVDDAVVDGFAPWAVERVEVLDGWAAVVLRRT